MGYSMILRFVKQIRNNWMSSDGPEGCLANKLCRVLRENYVDVGIQFAQLAADIGGFVGGYGT